MFSFAARAKQSPSGRPAVEVPIAGKAELWYRELRRAARQCMRDERDGHTLQTTALINEFYLRLPDLQGIDWQGRVHFFAICARQMRRILIDMAPCAKNSVGTLQKERFLSEWAVAT